MDLLISFLILIYILTIVLLLPYPLNYIYLAVKSRNYSDPIPKSYYRLDELPSVTIHLPVYNEPLIIENTLNQLRLLDYPKDKLKILIIDDSTDSTTSIIQDFIKKSKSGSSFEHLSRNSRIDYKAGALNYALKKTKSELILLLDADFRIAPDFLKETVHYFKDNSNVSAVQTRWTHSNQNFSLFTRAMSIAIDGHFLIEKPGRYRTNSFLSFNGTAGIWRKNAIYEAGGWLSRSLAEDLDLAYRSQFLGRKILFLKNITADQEITPTIRNWAIQQKRWSQGFAQNFRIHSKSLLTKKHEKNKIQGFLQLSSYFLPLFLLINLITSSLLLFIPTLDHNIIFALGSVLGIVSTAGILVYAIAVIRAKRPLIDVILIPLFLFWGISLSIRISYGVIIGLISTGGEFIRTPKFDLKDKRIKDKSITKSKISLDRQFILELVIFIIILFGFIKSIQIGIQLIFTSVFFGVVLLSILNLLISDIRHAFTKSKFI